jgi:hypothetical protein
MDLAIATASPIVLTRTVRYGSMTGPPSSRRPGVPASGATARADVGLQIGGTVRDRAGAPVAEATVVPEGNAQGALTAADGRYVLRGLAEGDVTLRVGHRGRERKPVQIRVPGASYDIVLDDE